MKHTRYILLSLTLLFVFGCETTKSSKTISGRVFYNFSNELAEEAKVHFGNKTYSISTPMFEEFTFTNNSGRFTFDKPDEIGVCYFYSEKYEGRSDYVSPIVIFDHNDSDDVFSNVNLRLYPIIDEHQIYGTISVNFDGVGSDDCTIILHHLINGEYTATDTTYSQTNGNYNFPDVQTGNCMIYASKQIENEWILETNKFFFFTGQENMVQSLTLEELQDEKPVIYIYPEEAGQFQINLEFNNKVKLTESIPEYKSGWDVFVEESGRMDDKYDYLFYETSMGTLPNLNSGWCLEQENIKTELPKILRKLGLNKQEIFDFMEYWLPRFDEREFYKFKLLINEQLDNYVELDISPKPDSVLRLLFFFEGCSDYEKLPTPKFEEFKRTGTTVVEWGGVLLN
jgi:hypothetical protein